MNKTMSDCYDFWALYICLNENGQEKNEAEAQNWLDWMKKLAKEEEQLQRTEPLIGCVNHDCAKCKELKSQDDSYCQACDGASCTAKKGCVALSNPPQRKPLTDEQIAEKFYKFEAASAWYQFARAIEAAHGIKE
jgi:hypothetical protein